MKCRCGHTHEGRCPVVFLSRWGSGWVHCPCQRAETASIPPAVWRDAWLAGLVTVACIATVALGLAFLAH